jgi:3-methylcrotonyl-CoA carboxylase alpha subunit
MFAKLLVANRGEIAVRIMQTCGEMGIGTVAVYSEADAGALHVRRANESYPIGPAAAARSYLRGERIIEVARQCHAEAIHPGYGFLSENPEFAAACLAAGLVFVGPPPEAMRRLGSKAAARAVARAAGVPVAPGYDGEDQRTEILCAEAERIGFPLLIKATAGGGGRGMRVVRTSGAFEAALESARREAQAAFGDATVLLERAIPSPRHIEFQVMADTHGNVIHLGERDCSVQRRHQKLIEESPAASLSPALRAEMGAAAVAIMRAAGYVNAGTVEFLCGPAGDYYFLEVNTRLQVEHPVTELVTGLDLVREQIQISAGLPLSLSQEAVQVRGHAMECRVTAEDVAAGFLPSSGTLQAFVPPAGPGIRNDVGVEGGDEVTLFYDSLLAKLIVHAPDRPACIARARLALARYRVLGVQTNLTLLATVLDTESFRSGTFTTDYLDAHLAQLVPTLQGTAGAVSPPPMESRQGEANGGGRDARAPSDFAPALHGATLANEMVALHDGGGRDARAPSGSAVTSVAPLPDLAVLAAACWQLARAPAGRDPWRAGPWSASGQDLTLSYYSGDQAAALTAHRESTDTWLLRLATTEHRVTILRTTPTLLFRLAARTWEVWVVETPEALLIGLDGGAYTLRHGQGPRPGTAAAGHHDPVQATGQALTAPMPGTVIALHAREGERVHQGQPVLVLEAMKMEHIIAAPRNGVLARLRSRVGERVDAGMVLAELED